jgi:hypothetical protein
VPGGTGQLGRRTGSRPARQARTMGKTSMQTTRKYTRLRAIGQLVLAAATVAVLAAALAAQDPPRHERWASGYSQDEW